MVSKVKIGLVAFIAGLLACFACVCVSQKAWAEGDDLILGMFWNSDTDLSDTLYLSNDGVNFNRITTPFQCEAGSSNDTVVGLGVDYVHSIHDPGLFYKDGNFWTVGGYVQYQDGLGYRLTPMFASSKDLMHWSYPGSGSDTNLAPTNTPAGTHGNGEYDTCGSEAFAASDGNVWFVTTLGYFGMNHGDSYNDTMMPYICKITNLSPGGNQETQPWARPNVSYGDLTPINLPLSGSDWLDPSLYEENGKYYLSIKKDGITDMIFSIDNLDNAGDANAWTLVCDNVVTGYEGPSLTKANGEYFMYTDKLKDYPFGASDGTAGTFVTRSGSLNSGWWGTQRISTKGRNDDGSTYDIPNRHGSVLKVPDEAKETVKKAYAQAGWEAYYEYPNIYGSTSADTSAKIATKAYPNGCDTVIVARDDDFADAMSATGLAGTLNAAIVLTDRNSLSSSAAEAIKTLKAKKAYIIGGTGAVKQEVDNGLKELGLTVEPRVFGNASWDTSVECAKLIKTLGGNEQSEVIVAMSSNFQDALSMSSYAYKYHVPILLETDANQGRSLTYDAIKFVRSTNGTIYVPGGFGAVPKFSVEGTFTGRTIQRLAGENGYDTSNQIATYMVANNKLSAETVCLTNGAPNPKGTDALAGAALAGVNNGVILLTNAKDSLGEAENYTTIDGTDSAGSAGFLKTNATSIKNTYVLGGPAVMPQSICERIEQYVTITKADATSA